jgi:Delta7-sterol 5-desaturase
MQQFKELLAYGFWDFITNIFIYSAVVLPFFSVFWVFLKPKFQNRRIQEKQRSTPPIIRQEIKNSIITILIFAIIDVALYIAQLNGYSQIYDNVSEYGWVYFVLSILIMILLHDAWFFFTHRLMHHPILFKHIHKVHHQSTDPSPFAAFSFHPLEAIVEAGAYIIFSFLFPVHLFALLGWQLIQMTLNVIGHLGYEIYPKGFNTHWLFRWKTPSTHHNMHHSKFNGNYGLYFTWWDRIFKTEFKDYNETYEKIQSTILKKGITTLAIFLFFSVSIFAQNQIVGKWLSSDQEGTTEIYEQNGKYFGKIQWLKKPNDNKGIPFTDTENPDKKLTFEPLIGLIILKDFVYKNNEWKSGTIYDPTNGKTYTCTMWLNDNNTLKVRGYWGLFYQTQTWTKK